MILGVGSGEALCHVGVSDGGIHPLVRSDGRGNSVDIIERRAD